MSDMQHSHFFADAAHVGEKISHSFRENVWFQRVMTVFQTLAVPLMYYFRPLCTAVALFWYARQLGGRHRLVLILQ